MKKLALLMFAILVLGCETETPMIEEPLNVIEEPLPVVASGERFRLEVEDPTIGHGDVFDGDADVDPEPLNRGGISYWFNEDLKLYKIDLRLKDGESLGWLPHGLVHGRRVGKVVRIQPVFGLPLLEFDTEYVITLYVQDLACNSSNFEIRFRTKPKP